MHALTINKPSLAIIDPGLMEAGGHHAGLASMLLDDLEQGKGEPLLFVCHQQVDKRLLARIENLQLPVAPLFSANFYQVCQPLESLPDYDHLIAPLAQEYAHAFKITNEGTADRSVILCPCVSWQHALAMNVGLALFKRNNENNQSCVIAVCAMFNPGLTDNGITIDGSVARFNQLAFSWLDNHSEVTLFASDEELSCAYQHLLNRPLPLPIHPCYLMNWQQFSAELQQVNREENRVILYTGDAKLNKGFLLLPKLVTSNLRHHPHTTWVIQFTQNWPLPELEQAILELENIAAGTPQVELVKGYWQPTEMMRQFARASAILLPYSSSAYLYKSSGVLWLAAFSKLKILLTEQSWLSREAERLGLNWQLTESSILPLVANDESQDSSDGVIYKNKLYRDIWDWLGELTPSLFRGTNWDEKARGLQ